MSASQWITAVFSSDLARAAETAAVAFADSAIPVLLRWDGQGGWEYQI
jgi:broad specificity phosphatase PhoE